MSVAWACHEAKTKKKGRRRKRGGEEGEEEGRSLGSVGYWWGNREWV